MIKSKYHGYFPAFEESSSERITEQGAEVTPLELLRRLQAGEPLGGTIYDDYDDDDDQDPLNTIGVEVENYGIIRDVVEATYAGQEAAAKERQRVRNDKTKDSGNDADNDAPPE